MTKKTILIGLLVVSSLLAAGCGFFAAGTATSATTDTSGTTRVADKNLLGQWTTEAGLLRVMLDEKGQPTGIIPIGQWIAFSANGTYFRVARYITFAIGGVSVEEGQFEAVNGSLLLFERKTSFYPDKGSPQMPSYRQTAENESLLYQISKDGSDTVLALKSGTDETGISYRYCPD